MDVEWPEFSADQDVYPNTGKNLRILRFSCGGEKFLNKEELWPHLPEFAEKISRFYGKSLPDFFTAHYADGGYTAVLLKQLTGISFSFTGHSLGAQKLDKLNVNSENWADLDNRFHFSQRLAAERVSIKYADIIFVSTKQERDQQYKHPLYSGAFNLDKNKKFNISVNYFVDKFYLRSFFLIFVFLFLIFRKEIININSFPIIIIISYFFIFYSF